MCFFSLGSSWVSVAALAFLLVVASRATLVAVCRLTVAVSLVAEQGLLVVRASVVAAHGISNLETSWF